jgi:hypothetical protein
MVLSFQLRYPDGLLWFNAHRPDRGVAASFDSGVRPVLAALGLAITLNYLRFFFEVALSSYLY